VLAQELVLKMQIAQLAQQQLAQLVPRQLVPVRLAQREQ
jgi:hypothetical protein